MKRAAMGLEGIHAGNAAGVTTIAALWGPFGREDLVASRPAYFLERISDLPRLLTDLQAAGNKGSKTA